MAQSETLVFRASPAHKAKLEALIKHYGNCSMGKVMRRLIDEAVQDEENAA